MSSQPGTRHRRGRQIGFAAFTIFTLFVVAELGALACGKFLQRLYKMYVVPVAQQGDRIKNYDDYLKFRDPVLGWPYPVELTGARYSPAFPDPAKSPNSVAVFGDSYAVGSEVDDDHAWTNQLALSLGSRVGNFGVPGYGTDQAYLRYVSMENDPSPVVILTHLSEDITRNLTRNWDLFSQKGYYALKPRFVLDDRGALQLVPLPQLSEHDYQRLVGMESPVLQLEHENFHPGGPAGVTRLTFPFSIAVVRNFGGYGMRSLLARRPNYAEFYWKGHPLGGLEITTKILESFEAETRRRGKWPLVVLLATRHDFNYVRRTGRWTYASLVEELERARVNYVDFGPALLKHMGNREVTAFFKPLGHYNEEANKLLAETVYETLRSRAVAPLSPPTR